MDWYKSIQRWHQMKIWSKEMVADAVVAGKITADQYKQIIVEEYVKEEPTQADA